MDTNKYTPPDQQEHYHCYTIIRIIMLMKIDSFVGWWVHRKYQLGNKCMPEMIIFMVITIVLGRMLLVVEI